MPEIGLYCLNVVIGVGCISQLIVTVACKVLDLQLT